MNEVSAPAPDHVASFLSSLPATVPPTGAVHHKALSLPFDRAGYDLAGFRRLVGSVPVIDDPVSVKRRSRDYYWFSPLVRKVLDGRYADLVVEPRDETEVMAVASACARLGIPLTVRGSGTGTYGQAVPLYGGVILDTSRLDAFVIEADRVTASAGARILAIDAAARRQRLELRMHPSTKKIATLGGYFCGGSGGIGSVTWGGLREPGNMLGARVISLEATPQAIDLTGAETGLVNRTFGTTGIVVSVTAPLAPAFDWIDHVVVFDQFPDALAFSHALASDPAITKKLVSTHAAESAVWLKPVLGMALPDGAALVLTMVADGAEARLSAVAKAHHGRITRSVSSAAAEADPKQTPVYEMSWGHTTLHALRQNPDISYLQALFPPGRVIETASAMWERFGAELPLHLEFIRYEGQVAANGAQLWPFTSVERLHEIIAVHEAAGIFIANPHVFTVEEGSRHKRVPGDQVGFKRRVDPAGLLNPGKMGAVSAAVL
jgi:FAD/FMN-containing dehydrogenase